MPFWAQRNHRLETRSVAGNRLWREFLQNARQDNTRLHLCQWHADTGARTTSKRKVCSRRNLLSICRVPAFGLECFRILPDIGQAMNNPLAENEHRTNGQSDAIQLSFLRNEAHLHPGWRIEAHRFV